jgi:hypothetical protein
VDDRSNSPSIYIYPVHWTYSKRIKADLYEDISVARSLGMVDPLQVAWEIVPYSFVVDWFLPVGSFLSAWAVIPKLRGRFLTIERAGAKAVGLIWKPGQPIFSWKNSNKKEQWFATTRTAGALNVPLPTFKRLPKALSPAHLYNAVALIHQLLK